MRQGGVLSWKSLEIALGNAKFLPLRGDPKTSKVHPPLVDGVRWSSQSSMVHGGGTQTDPEAEDLQN